ncbi:HipA domain-containing protein [Arabiibacter massiliensis]|uniref:HipA domain-containing protein n=1 Tax=Arabiibacter massiliensis TaxID=1870985 RepID=UPI0009BA3A68|nr:HipA domain-containing protein [Arabiibacter massiliensis]
MAQGETLNVYRGARLIGVLDREEGEPFYGFSYFESYVRSPEALPLSASLPLAPGRYPGAQTLPFFEGLLPEGDARSVVARQFHVSPRNPAQLIRALGRDCAGDVMVVEAGDPVQPPSRGEYLRLPRGLEDLARDPLREVAELRAEHRLSLAGAQEKIALYHDDREPLDDGWYVPANGSPSSHIVKPQVSGRFPHLALNEYLCMTAASLAGIEAAKASLLYPESPLLVVERFDRIDSGERTEQGLRLLTRVHQEDACQALGYCSDDKYEGASSAYVSEAVELLMACAERPAEALRELHRLMLFNYLIGNCDAHLKNYSLIWSGPASVRLAPAYDLVSTAVYDGRFGAKLDRGMGLRLGRHLNIDKVDADDLNTLAKELRQPPKAAWEERARLCDVLEEAFRQAAERAAGLGFGEAAPDLARRILFGAKIRMKVLNS